jgi:pilus assembly protein CpaB
MSITRIAILGVAIGAAVLAAVLAKGFVGSKPKTQVVEVNKAETVEVLVAANDVKIGGLLNRSTLSWQDWPKKAVAGHMITRKAKPEAISEYENARARAELFKGEPVSTRKLILPNQSGFMAAILPKGMRAIAVRVSVETGAGGFILPNDRVDVLLTRKLTGGQARTVTETVLTNVRVLAIDQTYTPSSSDGKKDQVAEKKINTATLELDPRQAEVVALAETTGQLTLALRALADNGSSELGDDGPRLSKKYATGAGEITVLRYGIAKQTATND